MELPSPHRNNFKYVHQSFDDPCSLITVQNILGFGMHCPEILVTNSITGSEVSYDSATEVKAYTAAFPACMNMCDTLILHVWLQ